MGQAIPVLTHRLARRAPCRVLTRDEESRVCQALGQPYALWVQFAVLTGLTRSEQFCLRWREVDLTQGTVMLPQGQAGTVTLYTLCPEAVTILRTLRAQQPASPWVFPDPKAPRRPANIHSVYSGRWTRAIRRAGIPWITWKDLRHTFGVRLAQAGHSACDLTRLLRHWGPKAAHVYRAWRPAAPPSIVLHRTPAASVFAPVTSDELARLLLREATRDPLTFGALCRLYATHHLRDKPSRPVFDRLYRQCFLSWADRPAETITRRELRAWHASRAHTPSHANKAVTFLKAAYHWAIDLELLTGTNPALRIRRYPTRARAQVVSQSELRRLFFALARLPVRFQCFVQVLLYTGARPSEACTARWVDLDLAAGLWRKPITKNGTAHVVPLPRQLVATLHTLPQTSVWLFPGHTPARPCALSSLRQQWAALRRRVNLDEIRLHDLRRTCASSLAEHGENTSTIQHVLNHASLVPTAIYARLQTAPIARALQAHADRFEALRTPAGPPEPSLWPLTGVDRACPGAERSLGQLLARQWARLSPDLQARYHTAAEGVGITVEQALVDAVVWRVKSLERMYGLSPMSRKA